MPRPDAFHVYDTTLRDGAQREGISYSVSDKLAVTRLLDSLGVGFIEGGWPGAMPKDTEFFARARDEIELQHALLVAFGATRKAGVNVEDDKQVAALLAANVMSPVLFRRPLSVRLTATAIWRRCCRSSVFSGGTPR